MIVPAESKRSARLKLLAAMLLGLAAMGVLQTFSRCLPGNDGYYHLKMALLLPDVGYVQTFPWLRWTIFCEQFVSHHHGFHTLLAPFALFFQWATGDAAIGGKLAAALAMAATFALLHVTLREIGGRPTLFWLLLLCAAPWHFWMRMAYVRAPMAALPLLVLAILWCLRGRTVALGVLAFAFTQVYGGAILFPLIPLCFLAADLTARAPGTPCSATSGPRPLLSQQWRTALWQCVAAGVGVALGMVVNPYFPSNLQFMYTQIFETGLAAPEHVGSEWKTFDGWNLLVQSGPLAAVWLWCLARRLRTAVAANSAEIALLLLNAAFLVLTLKARRFVEYWPIFAVLNAASFHAVSRNPARFAESVGSTQLPSAGGAGWRAWAPTAAIAVAAAMNLYVARRELEPSHDVAAIREAMAFMRENSPEGSLIMTDDWDSFPTCFYFNRHNTYAVGLDPEFTRARYPALWERYRRITRAEIPSTVPDDLLRADDAPASGLPKSAPCTEAKITYDDIANCFGADYVLVADDHGKLYKALMKRSDRFTPIYPPGLTSDTRQPAIAIFSTQSGSESDGLDRLE